MLKNILHHKPQIERTEETLTIPTATGEAGLAYPLQVIDNLRYLITRIQRDRPFPKRLAMVAALRGEGVSYLSLALAATLASDLKDRVCLVDLNWHWPLNTPFTVPENEGIASVLAGKATLNDVIAPTGLEQLSILPSGKVDRGLGAIYAHGEPLRGIIDQLCERFDRLIFDVPAILAISDAVPLAALADGCCLVIRHGVTGESDVKLALDEIRHLPVLGTVLNHTHYASPAPWIEVLMGRM